MEKWLGLKNASCSKSVDPCPTSKRWKPDYELQRNCKDVGRETISKWLAKYKWLRRLTIEKSENETFFECSWCKRAGKRNVFTEDTGRTCHKADVLTKHEKTDDHRDASLVANNKDGIIEWQRASLAANSKSELAIIAAMKIIYFQAKEAIATRKFQPMVTLCVELGGEVLKHLNCADNAKHNSYYSIRDMETSMCQVIQEDIMDKLEKSNWYSICIDESTDVSTTQSVIVYVKLVEKGTVCTHFLALNALKGCKADEIFETVMQVLNKYKIAIDKISGLGTDGASNMTGCRKGVTTLFKAKSEYIISIHCSAHRLALASGQAADTVPYLIKFQDILNRIFKMFHYSAKNTVLLKEIQNMLDMHEKQFVQTFSTRWLSFYKSVRVLLDNWVALVTLLIGEKSAVSQGLLKCISNYKFLATCAYLCDILFILNDLCLTFMKSTVDFNTVKMKVESCIKELRAIADYNTGTEFMKFCKKCPQEVGESGEFEYEGHVIKDNKKLRDEFECIRQNFMISLFQNLDERFKEIPSLGLFSFLLPCTIPKENDKIFSEYGVEEMKKVCNFFSSHSEFGNEYEMTNEWKILRRILVTRCEGMNLQECVKFLYVNGMRDMFPLLTSLFDYVVTLPMSTVDCERGFSLMNITKSDLRNRLSVCNLSNIMMLNLEGPESNKFNFQSAFQKWCSVRPRRL